MTDSGKRRGAKQNRPRKRHRPKTDDDVLITTVRKTLAKHPMHLLTVVSRFICWSTPQPGPWGKDMEVKSSLESVVAGLVERRCRETTALLAVLAEMLLGEDLLQERCRREVATRNVHLPKWIVELGHVEVRGVMRRTDVLGDGDELAIGLLLPGAVEMTLGAFLDHNALSVVTDVAVLAQPLDRSLARAREGVDSATTFVDTDPADARLWIESGLTRAEWFPQPDGWREGLPLVRWLLAQLPGGGTAYAGPEWDDDAVSELLDGFFASPEGAPFTNVGYRELLLELCATGCGDPSRWSTHRLSDILRYPFRDDHVPLEIALDTPALLRAYIPFVHANSRIRQDLTDEAITAIDEESLRFKRALLAEASEHDDLDFPPWGSSTNQAS